MSDGVGRDAPQVEVEGRDEQRDVEIDVARWVSLAEHAVAAEGVQGAAELSLLFVDEAAMADLNGRYMDQAGPTDVLAFPIDDDHDAGDVLPSLLGDVVVCPAVAARQAPEHGADLEEELALLVVHGVLHVLGHDHADPTETAAMQAREREILGTFDS